MNSNRSISIELVKRFLPLLILVLFGFFVIRIMQDSSSAESGLPQGRKMTVKGLKDMPIEVRAVKNLEADNWIEALQIEIKNTGQKPIYCISAHLSFPDTKQGNMEVGVPLDFGNMDNMDLRRLAPVDDPHLNPGEVNIWTIPEELRKGLDERVKNLPNLYVKSELEVHLISFGDGTGIDNFGFQDERSRAHKPEVSSVKLKKKIMEF